jgi:hypothetical protein
MTVYSATRNLEAPHGSAQLMIIPIIRSNTDLGAALAIAIHAQGAVRAPLILPIDNLACTGGCLGAATVVFAVPLSGGGGKDPCVGHGQHGDEGGNGGGGELHFDDLRRFG